MLSTLVGRLSIVDQGRCVGGKFVARALVGGKQFVFVLFLAPYPDTQRGGRLCTIGRGRWKSDASSCCWNGSKEIRRHKECSFSFYPYLCFNDPLT